jgi:hypothetical protein
VGGQAGQSVQQPPVVVDDGVQGERQHPHLVAAVQQRQVDPYAVCLRHLDGGSAPEGRAGGGAINRRVLADGQPPTRQRHQHQLFVVLQEDRDVTAPDPAHHFHDQRGDQMRWHLVGLVQQHPQQPLTESFRPVHRALFGLRLSCRHSRTRP